MYRELTNLLPPERRNALVRGYFVRLSVVAVLFITALTCVSGVLLVPTYVFLSKTENAKQTRLAAIEASLSSTDEVSLSTRLTALSQNTAALNALAPFASTMIRAALALPRAGILLTSFNYLPQREDVSSTKTTIVPGTLAITGTARTRDALRNYQLSLQGASFARAAALPVSAYAKDSDIPFTIVVTLAP